MPKHMFTFPCLSTSIDSRTSLVSAFHISPRFNVDKLPAMLQSLEFVSWYEREQGENDFQQKLRLLKPDSKDVIFEKDLDCHGDKRYHTLILQIHNINFEKEGDYTYEVLVKSGDEEGFEKVHTGTLTVVAE